MTENINSSGSSIAASYNNTSSSITTNIDINSSSNNKQPTSTTNPNNMISKWPIDLKSYDFQDQIGQGATAQVFTATCHENGGKLCAIKIMNMEACPSVGGLREIEREIASMKKLKHKNIVTYYTSFITDIKLYIVMEMCARGSLLDIIKQTHGKPEFENGVFDQRLIATILIDVLNGLQYIHDNNLVHRDLKCGNLLLTDECVVQIADFGVTGFLAVTPLFDEVSSAAGGIPARKTFVGTPCWMAPEVMHQVYTDGNPGLDCLKEALNPDIKACGYNWKADIWSLGVTTIEMAAGSAPYSTWPPMKVILTTIRNDPPTVDSCNKLGKPYEAYGNKYRRFVGLCMRKKASERPSAKDLLHHEFIKSYCRDHAYLKKHMFSLHPPSKRIFRTVQNSDKLTTNKPLTVNRIDSDDSLQGKKENNNNNAADNGDTWIFDETHHGTVTVGNNEPLVTKEGSSSSNILSVPEKSQSCNNAGVTKRLRITLRKRLEHNKNELQDISFDFVMGTDSTNSLSNELVEANLIDRKDLLIVGENMQVLVNNPSLRDRLFQLNTPPPNGIPFSEVDMQGFAKLIVKEYPSGELAKK